MNLLEEIKRVDPKTPGNWPWPVKLVACMALSIAVVAGGFVFDWQEQMETLDGFKREEVGLKETFLAKKKQAINLDIIKKQLMETQQSFGALLKQLPNKSEMDALLTDINQAGLGRGLQFELFRPGAEVMTGVFAEQSIAIRVTGSYDDLGRFSSDISQLPRIVTLNDISINPINATQLSMDTTAKTYRYLDDDELATQKKSGKPGAKK